MYFEDFLTKEDHTRGAEMRVMNTSTEKPTDIYIKFFGVQSLQYRSALRAASAHGVSKKSKQLSIEDEYKQKAIFLSEITKSWRGMKDSKGRLVKFTKQKAVTLFDGSIDLCDQAMIFVSKNENFTKG